MKKPVICFLGDKNRCNEIIKRFGKKIKSRYISRISAKERIYAAKPTLICFIMEQNKFGNTSYYFNALNYSRKTLCPIFVVGSYDQFNGIKKFHSKSVMHKVTTLGLYKIISDILNKTEKPTPKNIDAVKDNFDTIVIISSDPILTAYCENKILLDNTPDRRINIVSPNSPELQKVIDNKDKFAGFIVTEPLSGTEFETITLGLAKPPVPKIPMIFLENNERYNTRNLFTHFNVNVDEDEISKVFSKSDRSKIKTLPFGENDNGK